MNASIIIPSNGDNDWGLFVDIDSNHTYIPPPTVAINQIEKYKSTNKKKASHFEYCFQYIYYYLDVYIIHYGHK